MIPESLQSQSPGTAELKKVRAYEYAGIGAGRV